MLKCSNRQTQGISFDHLHLKYTLNLVITIQWQSVTLDVIYQHDDEMLTLTNPIRRIFFFGSSLEKHSSKSEVTLNYKS